jgi:adenine-specific DNA-methyltransferase
VKHLTHDGRLVFITPEKFLYTETAAPLRKILAKHDIEEIRFLPEDTFGSLVTYPTVTVLNNGFPTDTRVIRRDGTRLQAHLPRQGESWLPAVQGRPVDSASVVLGDVCLRISCGVATGADDVFVQPNSDLHPDLKAFAYPTLSGRELSLVKSEVFPYRHSMLVPYDKNGGILPWKRLGALRRYLQRPDIQRRLKARYCVKQKKPWYAFHETPRLSDILRPKILCKDIGERPHFWVDWQGAVVPRHSLYYIVPKRHEWLLPLLKHLQSKATLAWLEATANERPRDTCACKAAASSGFLFRKTGTSGGALSRLPTAFPRVKHSQRDKIRGENADSFRRRDGGDSAAGFSQSPYRRTFQNC